MKRFKYILTAITLGLGGVIFANGAYADLQEQTEVEVDFTFNPVLAMVLSDDAIAIADLAPGQAKAMTNDMTITVTTNSAAGYKLSASVGNATNPTSNLTLSSTSYFESLATDASLALNNFGSGNKWGYSTNSGTSYSGLPAYTATAKEINATTGANSLNAQSERTGSVTTFRIGASSTAGQSSGVYTNVINFTAVTNVVTE